LDIRYQGLTNFFYGELTIYRIVINIYVAQFQLAPLRDEEERRETFYYHTMTNDRVQTQTSQLGASRSNINIEENVEGSLCDGEANPLVTCVWKE
jgi:hypothetical protein